MFIDIEAFFLNTLVYAQSMQFLDTVEQDDTAGGSPEVNDQYAEALSTEEAPSITIEGTITRR